MRASRFSALDPASFADTTIILDVDGTLVPDGRETLATPERLTLEALAAVARVYLCSNTRAQARVQAMATELGVGYLPQTHRKPDIRVIEPIPVPMRTRLVVIGDKYLTDGRLAERLGARFVMVERVREPRERLAVRLAYLIDWIAGRVLRYTHDA